MLEAVFKLGGHFLAGCKNDNWGSKWSKSCPKCPVFWSMNSYNFIVSKDLINVHLLEVDIVIERSYKR